MWYVGDIDCRASVGWEIRRLRAGNVPLLGMPRRPSIVVMPFANLSDDPAQDYFSDGITEDIITELSRWRLFVVRSPSARSGTRGVAVDMKQVARELKVRFVVEGSVRRMGERIRISVQLVDAETGNDIWLEKFDRRVGRDLRRSRSGRANARQHARGPGAGFRQ